MSRSRNSGHLLLALLPALLLFLGSLALLSPRPVLADSFTVDSLGDGGDTNPGDTLCIATTGGCTLRAAVEQANALAGPDTISFNLGAPATIPVGDQIAIRDDLTITGPGAGALSLNGGGADRIFAVQGGTVTLENLTLTGGNVNDYGGAAHVSPLYGPAALNLSGVIAEANNAFYGGAFYLEDALLQATASEIRNNAAARGGGIYQNAGTVRLINSNLDGNYASQRGGGLYHQAGGGSATYVESSSRVRYNRVEGIHPDGRGGGIYNEGGNVTFENSFLEENVATTWATACHPVYNTPGGSGGGLYAEEGSVELSGSTVFSNTARVTGSCTGTGQPEVGWGGGLYLSHTLGLFASSLFDANTADWAGAVRAGGSSTLTVHAATFTANEAAEGYGGALYIDGRLAVRNSLFRENWADGSFAVGGGGAIHTRAGRAAITNTTFLTNSSRFGGAVDNGAWLQVTNSTFSGNRSWTINGCGGALYNAFATAQIANSTFSLNEAVDFGPRAGGGGICNEGTMSVLSSTLRENSAARFGGAIRNEGELHLLNSELLANVAENSSGYESGGGALYNIDGFFGGRTTIAGSTFSGNSSGDDGGAILNRRAAVLTLTHSTLDHNISVGDGAGIYQDAGTASFPVRLVNSTLSRNDAGAVGGGVYVRGGALALNHATLWANSAAAKGAGGLHTSITGTITASHAIVAHNSALISGQDCAGTILVPAGVRNLDSDGTCSGFALQNRDPLLNPLADNGGATPTHALSGGSPADNTALAADCVTVDQRGAARATGPVCDLGAYERVNTETCTDNAPIYVPPGGGFAQDTITLPAVGPVVDADIFVQIAHEAVGNLISFVEHGGTSVALFNGAGGAGCPGDNIKAVLDDEAIYSINSACTTSDPAVEGTFSPYGTLSDFDGLAAGGNWDLGLSNQDSLFTATIENWCVRADTFACLVPGAPNPAITIDSSSRVRLDWSPDPAASHVLVYRARDPYFTLTPPPYGATGAGFWRDPDTAIVGDVAGNRYYRLRAAGGCGGGLAGQRVGIFNFGLTPGS